MLQDGNLKKSGSRESTPRTQKAAIKEAAKQEKKKKKENAKKAKLQEREARKCELHRTKSNKKIGAGM